MSCSRFVDIGMPRFSWTRLRGVHENRGYSIERFMFEMTGGLSSRLVQCWSVKLITPFSHLCPLPLAATWGAVVLAFGARQVRDARRVR